MTSDMDDVDTDRLNNTRRQIESNDPELDKLTIARFGRNNYHPPDEDWARDGRSIGKNTHIKELGFGSDLSDYVFRDNLEAFCRGLEGNISIQRLQVYCCDFFHGEIFNMLCPFFEQNYTLRCLSIGGYGFESEPNSVRLLIALLFRFNNLREFECRGNIQVCDNEKELLIRALAGHSRLTKVDLTGNKVGVRALASLPALLNNPNSSLADLILAQCSLDDEGALVLASVVGSNGTLRKLDLGSNGDISSTGWRALFTQLQNPHSSLEHLDLWENSIDNAAVNLLATALANGSINLEVLTLGENHYITTEGWRSLSTALQNPRCMLQELHLYNNNFNDDDVAYLAISLGFNGILKHLDLAYNMGVSSSGWRAFLAFLQNPNSALEELDLGGNLINDDVLASFANSLTHNNKLKELFIDDRNITSTGWDALSNVLCNKSSIEETFNSNHTLQTVFDPEYTDESDLPSDLRTLLQLNRGNNKMEAARRKILQVHFSGSFNMQPFIDMDLTVLPHAVAWMARDEHGSSLLYQFVRNTTLFVDVDVGGEV